MLVHHSRNSVQKQWEETLVLALGGMARILRAHLPILVPMPGFSQVSSCPFSHIAVASLGASPQVRARASPLLQSPPAVSGSKRNDPGARSRF